NAATEAAVPVLVWLVVSLFNRGRGSQDGGVDGFLAPACQRPLFWLVVVGALLMVALPQAKEAWLMLAGAGLAVALCWARSRDREDYVRSWYRTAGVLAVAVGLACLAVVA